MSKTHFKICFRINIHFYPVRWELCICQPADLRFTPAGDSHHEAKFSIRGPNSSQKHGFRMQSDWMIKDLELKDLCRPSVRNGDGLGDSIFREGSRSQSVKSRGVFTVPCFAMRAEPFSWNFFFKHYFGKNSTPTVYMFCFVFHLSITTISFKI